MNIEFDLSSFKAELAAKQKKFNDARRPAAQAGAQVIYEQTRINVPVGLKGHYFYGTASKNAPKGQKKALAYYFDAGTLRDAIYQVHSKDHSGATRDEYHIAWNHKEAPYGFMVEFGTSNAPARSFLGPAIASSKGRAGEAMRQRFIAEVNS